MNKNNLITYKERQIMIIKEENKQLEVIKYDSEIFKDNLISLITGSENYPHLKYYAVFCDRLIGLGLTAEEIFQCVCYKYINSKFKPLNEVTLDRFHPAKEMYTIEEIIELNAREIPLA